MDGIFRWISTVTDKIDFYVANKIPAPLRSLRGVHGSHLSPLLGIFPEARKRRSANICQHSGLNEDFSNGCSLIKNPSHCPVPNPYLSILLYEMQLRKVTVHIKFIFCVAWVGEADGSGVCIKVDVFVDT